MKNKTMRTGLLAFAGALALASAAQAQYVTHYSDGAGGYGYRNEPLYPYVVQPRYTNAVPQYGPSITYTPRTYPYIRSQDEKPAKAKVGKTDPVLVEELRRRGKPRAAAEQAPAEKEIGGKKIHKTVVVREKPIVRDHVRVVDDPPIIVQREISEDQLVRGQAEPMPPAGRTIRAEAEVTIIGPDRMSIRLFRKRDGIDANAEAKPKAPPKAHAKADTKSKIR